MDEIENLWDKLDNLLIIIKLNQYLKDLESVHTIL